MAPSLLSSSFSGASPQYDCFSSSSLGVLSPLWALLKVVVAEVNYVVIFVCNKCGFVLADNDFSLSKLCFLSDSHLQEQGCLYNLMYVPTDLC